MQVYVLAGGLGTRLGKLTKKTPKIMVKINSIPFIDYQLSHFYDNGITNIIYCLGHYQDQVCDYIESKKISKIKIQYAFETDQLLGTGGAIKNALHLAEDKFIVQYGDSFLPIKYADIYNHFIRSNKSALMTIYKNKHKHDRSNIYFNGKKIMDYEKLSNHNIKYEYIDYGCSLFKKKVFSDIKEKEFDLSNVFKKLVHDDDLDHFTTMHRFYEIGSHSGIKEFQIYLDSIRL